MTENVFKIGLLAGSLKGAGAEKTILTLADFLARENCNVNLFLLNDDSDYVAPDNINIVHLKGEHRKDKKTQLHELTKKSSYDLFITSRPDYYTSAVACNKYVSVHISPYSWIRNERKNFLSRYLKLLRIKSKYKNKKIIALSQGIRDELVNHLGCNSADITVINNPFNIETIRAESTKLGPLPDKEYIIYVASLIPRKRHKDLIQAFHNLDSDLDLVFVGKGPCEQELKSLAQKLNLSDRILFWGWDKNPYRLIKNAKLSVLTSESEGLPRTLIESLILGTPAISTDCPSGPNEVMTGPFSQFLAAVGDIDKLTEIMQSALNNYPDLKLLNLERFAGKNVAARYLNLLKGNS